MGKLYDRRKYVFNSSVLAILILFIAFFCSITNVKAVAVGTKYMYTYTGEYQEFTAPESTWYKVELYGAAGGYGRTDWSFKWWGGAGAYTSGEIYLEKGTKLYVYVGGMGGHSGLLSKCSGGTAGWNGGAIGGNDSNCDSNPEPGGGGGGATDIRLVPTSAPTVWDEFDSLKSRIMVAAGGGGGAYHYAGGQGGIIYGIQIPSGPAVPTQTTGLGYSGFGVGQNGVADSYGTGGGGGGYYGGLTSSSGEGGSSFVSGCYGCNAVDKDSTSTNIIHTGDNVHYSGLKFDNIEMLSGADTMPNDTGTMVGNAGNGAAVITVSNHRSTNNYLKNITTSNGMLSPTFSKTEENYNLVLDSDVSEVDLNATVDDSKSVVVGNTKYQVKYGEQVTANLSVTNELGEVRVYKVNISRKQLASGEHSSLLADLGVKAINKGAIVPKISDFNPNTLEYNIVVSPSVAALDFDAIPLDSGATVTKEGTNKILGDSGTLKIIVSEPNSSDTTYLIHYTKDSIAKVANEYSAVREPQEFIAPVYGKYRIQLWGAQGFSTIAKGGGKGAYTKGDIILEKGEKLYFYVGDNTYNDSYNGGGKKDQGLSFSGGGATDVRLVNGAWDDFTSLKSRIMVAAGGGGGTYWGIGSYGGAAGGLYSYDIPELWDGSLQHPYTTNTGATQTSAGRKFLSFVAFCEGNDGKFGIGGDGSSAPGCGGAAGGGGYFGGSGGGASDHLMSSGAGGSSYISGHNGCKSVMENSIEKYVLSSDSNIHYSNKYFTDTKMIDGLGYEWIDENGPTYTANAVDGNWSNHVVLDDGYYTGQPTTDGSGIQEGQEGNGFARIELLNDSNNNYLAELKTNYGKFSEDFDPLKNKITLNLDKYEQHFTLTGVLADKTSTVTGLEQYRVGLGETKVINIAVTSANGETRIYEVTAKRGDFAPGEHSTKLDVLDINQGSYSLDPEFISIETNYEISAPYSAIALDVDAIPYDNEAKVKIEGNGYLGSLNDTIKVTVTHQGVETTVYTIKVKREENIEGKKVQYECTGEEQEFIAPASTYYRIQLWGASGGVGKRDNVYQYNAGLGAYTDGEIYLKKGQKLYVYVGCMGNHASTLSYYIGGLGGFNGGGKGGDDANHDSAPEPGGGGGGATDVRLVPSSNKINYWEFPSLKSRIMVAAGGGGSSYYGIGGSGGALFGYAGWGAQTYPTQNSGFAFGRGAEGPTTASVGYGGGGGGYYGGESYASGNGGSSFVSGCDGCLAIDQASTETNIIHKSDGIHYSGMVFDKIAMKSGADLQPSTTDGFQTGNINDGHAIITAAKPRSENNFLSSLTVDKGTLTPGFDVLERNYSVKLTPEEDTITIDAKLDDQSATMKGTGTFDVPAGKTTFPITVRAENGNIRIYTVTVEREKSSNPYPLDISIKGLVPALCNVNSSYCHLTPGFNPDTNSYSIKVPSKLDSVDFVVTKANKYQTVIGDGTVKLEKGVNTFTIEVVSEDGQNVSTYTYSIERDMTGDANISKLEVLDPATNIQFNPDTVEYTFSVPNGYTSVGLKIELQDPDSTYKVVGNENFVVGLNLVNIEVTAQNGEKKTYTLKVYREQSGNTFIDEIRVEHDSIIYPLTPTYNKMYHDYTVNVPNEIDEVDIIATPEHSLTTITGDGTKTLNTGVNKFELTSTSEDGSVDVYKISIVREKSNDATLKSLDVLEGTLSPTFQSNTLMYDVEVSSGVSSLTLNPVLNDSKASYRVTGNSNFVVGKNVVYITVTAENGARNIYVINVTKKANSNNYLSALAITNQTLNPVFNKETQKYNVTVTKDIATIFVAATPEDSKAKVSNRGYYNLAPGMNTVDIVVTAEDGSKRTYTIEVFREMASDSTLASLTTSSKNSYTPVFAPTTTQYNLEVEREEDRITVVGVSSDPNAKVTGNATYALKVGNNTIDIKVKAQNGAETVYTLVVRRKASNNVNLSMLIAKESVLDPAFEKNTLNYELRVLESVTSLTLLMNLEDPNATYEVIGNENFVIGHNTVKIKVTAEDGTTTREYILDVLRQAKGTTSNRLLKLETSEGTLDPTFDPDTNYYEVEVPNETDNIALDGELEDKNATVTGFQNYPLTVGKNTLSVKVTSTENIVRYYQVIVTRKGKSEARLQSLTVDNHTISPTFDKDTYEYSMTTEMDALTVKAEPIDSNAKVTITGDIGLQFGQNQVLIKVVAEDGVTTKEYKIKVEKEKSKNNNLKSLVVNGLTLTPAFSNSTTVYVATDVVHDINTVVVTAVPEDNKATISGDGKISLAMGKNYIDITVTSEAGTKKVYTVVINRLASSDNDLASLYTSEGTLSPVFNKTIHDYTVTVPYEVEDIVVSGTLSDVNASVVGFDKYKLEVGNNPIKIIVTAEDGTVDFYNIVVTRENIVSSLLENLSIKDYKMDQTFASELFDYTVTVDYEVTDLILNIKTLDKNATYVVNGNSNFNVGMNTVEIVVTDSLGQSSSTYTLNVNRQNYSNTYLSYIYTDKGDLDPIFEKGTLSYKVEVDSDVDTINVMAAAEVATNTVEGVATYSLKPGDNLVAITVKTPEGIKRVYYVNIVRKQDDSNDLTSLRVKANDEEQTLDPVFKKDHLDYSVTVSPSTPSVEILATTTNKASISGVGTRPLKVGDNVFNVTVTSESGVAKVYTITVHREPSDNNYLASLVPSAGTLDPVFNEKQQEYTLKVDSNTTTLSFTAKPKDQFATVSGTEIAVVDQDELLREIVVTAENGDIRTYKVKVIKERSDEARLSELKIPNYPFEETFDKDTFNYTVTLPQGKTELTKDDVIATPIDSKAVVTKMEKLTLSTEQDNIYKVEVTARDGFTKQTYTIKVNLVTDIDITKIILDDEYVLGVGEKLELKPTFEPADATNKEIEYVSQDTDIATVENGEITGIKEGETTIVVSSKKDPTVKKEIKVKVMNLKISSQVYDVRRGVLNLLDSNKIKDIIIGAEPNESLTDFISKLDNDASLIKIYDHQDQVITDLDNSVVTTGYKIQLEFKNKVYDSVYIVVRGEVTKDGVVDSDDYNELVRQLLKKLTYSHDSLEFRASDVIETDEIDADDSQKTSKYILKKDNTMN